MRLDRENGKSRYHPNLHRRGKSNRGVTMRIIFGAVIVCVLLTIGCKAVRPDRDDGPVIDSSRNISASLFDPAAKPDNPFPIQAMVFIRHFHYFSRSTPWSIVSSGDSSPGTYFEEAGVYLLRLRSNELPLRLAKIPGFQTDGLTPPRAYLAVAAKSVVVSDGVPLVRNVAGDALFHMEDGPLYGGFTVEIPDTAAFAEQLPRLLVNARVRAAALAFDGVTAAYVDDAIRLFRLDTVNGSGPELGVDIRKELGPSIVSSIQWGIQSNDILFIRLDRGLGPESWTFEFSKPQLGPSAVSPDEIQEPGADRLPLVDLLTHEVPAAVWRVPSPQQFAR